MKLSHIIAIIIGLLLGGAGGFAAGIFFFPILFPPPPAMEQLAAGDARTLVAEGTFIHADPNDPVHYGMGGVKILRGDTGRHVVFLDEKFKVGPGPRFHVYLTEKPDIGVKNKFDEKSAIDLGQLRAFEGSQIFKIPSAVDITPVRSVVIWCKEFHVLISSATLKRPAG